MKKLCVFYGRSLGVYIDLRAIFKSLANCFIILSVMLFFLKGFLRVNIFSNFDVF